MSQGRALLTEFLFARTARIFAALRQKAQKLAGTVAVTEPVEATARPTWGTPAPHMAQAVRGAENPPTLWAHTHLIYRRKNMAYTKPQIVAQNSATGSYAAGCPTNDNYASYNCRNCERTE